MAFHTRCARARSTWPPAGEPPTGGARPRGSDVIPSTPNERSIHIDAPVEMVFRHVEDPNNFVRSDPEPVRLSDLKLTAEGLGSTWDTSWHVLGIPLHAAWTRVEYVPNQRIVDRASTGVTWTYTTEPDPEGTTLHLAFAITTRLPVANRVLDRAFRSQGRQLEKMLAGYRNAIQAC